MPTTTEYAAKVRRLRWPGLRKLWEGIKSGDTPGWEPGKAFEFLVLRAYELDGAAVTWPYSVSLSDEEVDQIDGAVRIGHLYALVESKDEADNVAIGPIAKMRNQLLRRPAGTIGLLFSSRGFTAPALQLAPFTLPQAVLLWPGVEVEYALAREGIAELTERKFRACVEKALPDFDIREEG